MMPASTAAATHSPRAACAVDALKSTGDLKWQSQLEVRVEDWRVGVQLVGVRKRWREGNLK
jgi:hypothetical protein